MATTYPKIFSDNGLPDQEAYLYANVKYLDTTTNEYAVVTEADVSSIAWTVKVRETGASVTSGTFAASDVIHDTLITSPEGDSCNFRGRFAGTCFPTGGTVYQIRVVITFIGSPANTAEIVVNYTTRPVV